MCLNSEPFCFAADVSFFLFFCAAGPDVGGHLANQSSSNVQRWPKLVTQIFKVGQKFRALQFGGPNNNILAQFGTVLRFDHEYLWSGTPLKICSYFLIVWSRVYSVAVL